MTDNFKNSWIMGSMLGSPILLFLIDNMLAKAVAIAWGIFGWVITARFAMEEVKRKSRKGI